MAKNRANRPDTVHTGLTLKTTSLEIFSKCPEFGGQLPAANIWMPGCLLRPRGRVWEISRAVTQPQASSTATWPP